jgi:hypothetical protein
MRAIAALLVLLTLLSGCAEMADARRRAQAQAQEREQQCAAQGWVMYKKQCMSPQDAKAERDRSTMLHYACIQRGGMWSERSSQCIGNTSDVNVNVRRDVNVNVRQ